MASYPTPPIQAFAHPLTSKLQSPHLNSPNQGSFNKSPHPQTGITQPSDPPKFGFPLISLALPHIYRRFPFDWRSLTLGCSPFLPLPSILEGSVGYSKAWIYEVNPHFLEYSTHFTVLPLILKCLNAHFWGPASHLEHPLIFGGPNNYWGAHLVRVEVKSMALPPPPFFWEICAPLLGFIPIFRVQPPIFGVQPTLRVPPLLAPLRFWGSPGGPGCPAG